MMKFVLKYYNPDKMSYLLYLKDQNIGQILCVDKTCFLRLGHNSAMKIVYNVVQKCIAV